jgi:hypothetical protein
MVVVYKAEKFNQADPLSQLLDTSNILTRDDEWEVWLFAEASVPAMVTLYEIWQATLQDEDFQALSTSLATDKWTKEQWIHNLIKP